MAIDVGTGDDQQELLPGLPLGSDSLLGADLDAVPSHRWPQELVRLIEVQEAAYARSGIDRAEAFRLARIGVSAIAEFCGGRDFYLPRGDVLKDALRDAEIYRRARRSTIHALADEYGLTVRHVRRIVRQQYNLHLSKVQGRLFNEQGGVHG